MMNNAAINNTDGFEKFGKSFQEKLCKLIMFDRPFADQMEEVLDVSFFENKALQELTKLVFKHRREYNIHPSKKLWKLW